MNLESTNSYGLSASLLQQTAMTPDTAAKSTTETKNETSSQISDSFLSQTSNNQEILVAGLPTWNDITRTSGSLMNETRELINGTLNSTGEAIGDLWNGEFKAYKLGPLVGGNTQKAKEISDHLNFLNSGNPSTVTIGYDKTLVDKMTERLTGSQNDTMPDNLYVITSDSRGNLTASQPSSGTVHNVVGVALKNTDGSIDLMRITGDSKIGLRNGSNGNALFSTTTDGTSRLLGTLKTIK